MRRWTQIAIVAGGYVLALVAAAVTSHLYNARMAAQPYDTSGGMYAAGESMAALAAFLVVALVPTVVALVLLRRNTMFWHLVALASVGFAGVGLIAVVVTLVARSTPSTVGLMLLDLIGLAQLLGVPLWTVAFVVFAILAPTRPARRLLVAAIGIELVIGVCAAFHWLGGWSRL